MAAATMLVHADLFHFCGALLLLTRIPATLSHSPLATRAAPSTLELRLSRVHADRRLITDDGSKIHLCALDPLVVPDLLGGAQLVANQLESVPVQLPRKVGERESRQQQPDTMHDKNHT